MADSGPCADTVKPLHVVAFALSCHSRHDESMLTIMLVFLLEFLQ